MRAVGPRESKHYCKDDTHQRRANPYRLVSIEGEQQQQPRTEPKKPRTPPSVPTEYQHGCSNDLRERKNPNGNLDSLRCKGLRKTSFHTSFQSEQYLGNRDVVGELGKKIECKPPISPMVAKANAADQTRMARVNRKKCPHKAAVNGGGSSSPDQIAIRLDRSEDKGGNRTNRECVACAGML